MISDERLRFIPALAGNMETGGMKIVTLTVHPRASGEHTTPADADDLLIGSSPR